MIIEEIINLKYRLIMPIYLCFVLINICSILVSSFLSFRWSIRLFFTWFRIFIINAIYHATYFSRRGSICLRLGFGIIWRVGRQRQGWLACQDHLELSWRGSCSLWMSMGFCSLCQLACGLLIGEFCLWRRGCLSLCQLLFEGF